MSTDEWRGISLILLMLLAFSVMCNCIVIPDDVKQGRDQQWAEGKVRVSPTDHKTIEEWHAPLKPGDAPWWEPAK